jgi:hypothetical protein
MAAQWQGSSRRIHICTSNWNEAREVGTDISVHERILYRLSDRHLSTKFSANFCG